MNARYVVTSASSARHLSRSLSPPIALADLKANSNHIRPDLILYNGLKFDFTFDVIYEHEKFPNDYWLVGWPNNLSMSLSVH